MANTNFTGIQRCFSYHRYHRVCEINQLKTVAEKKKEIYLKILQCHYGFSKIDFLESLINGEQDEKKISESDLSFASNSLLKSGAFGSRPRKQKPGTNYW